MIDRSSLNALLSCLLGVTSSGYTRKLADRLAEAMQAEEGEAVALEQAVTVLAALCRRDKPLFYSHYYHIWTCNPRFYSVSGSAGVTSPLMRCG